MSEKTKQTAAKKKSAPSESARRPTAQPTLGDPLVVLKERFGMDQFREGQHAVIERLLAGKNVAAVFPTGGGKSLCYQLPSLMFEGTTVIVSPLIALMKDQCDALAARGIPAARLDSSLESSEVATAMRGIRDRSIRMLYVAPERFFNERFIASLGTLQVSLFAIDEAHCISQWGHNFRPDYLKLAELAKDLSAERVLALTATATPGVLTDICDAFAIDSADAIRTRFFRPNLELRSSIVDSESQYDELLKRIRSREPGATIVYVSLQRTAKEIAERLTADGFASTAYHAGLDNDVRATIQQDFIASTSGIIVATIAFGMGIDKSDIRYVYHYNPPKSLEAYAQEIGRAGRDGKDSVCEVLLAPDDRIVLENFTYGDTPSRHAVGRLIDLLIGQAETFHLSHYKLSSETDIRILVVRTLLTYMELDGYIKATSPRYDTFKIQPRVTSQTILNHYTGERRKFIGSVLASLTKGRTWFLLDMAVATRRIGGEREDIVRAIDEMSEAGWIEVQVADLVHGYRWLRRPESPKTLADSYHARLTSREAQEIVRLDDVYVISRAESCQAAQLSSHFGETIGEPCGRCTACRGDGPLEIPTNKTRKIGSSALKAVQEVAKQYPDHFTSPRDQARFLCGLGSPHFTRARLTRDANFGICDRVPFAEVLKQLS